MSRVPNAGAARVRCGAVPPSRLRRRDTEAGWISFPRGAALVSRYASRPDHPLAYHFGTRMAARGRGGIVLVTSGAAWAGASHLAVYSATKAFDLLGMVLGVTDTPAFRKILGERQYGEIADPDDVARDMLDRLPDGPTFPPGPSPFGDMPRREAVQPMTQGAAALHD